MSERPFKSVVCWIFLSTSYKFYSFICWYKKSKHTEGPSYFCYIYDISSSGDLACLFVCLFVNIFCTSLLLRIVWDKVSLIWSSSESWKAVAWMAWQSKLTFSSTFQKREKKMRRNLNRGWGVWGWMMNFRRRSLWFIFINNSTFVRKVGERKQTSRKGQGRDTNPRPTFCGSKHILKYLGKISIYKCSVKGKVHKGSI